MTDLFLFIRISRLTFFTKEDTKVFNWFILIHNSNLCLIMNCYLSCVSPQVNMFASRLVELKVNLISILWTILLLDRSQNSYAYGWVMRIYLLYIFYTLWGRGPSDWFYNNNNIMLQLYIIYSEALPAVDHLYIISIGYSGVNWI